MNPKQIFKVEKVVVDPMFTDGDNTFSCGSM